MLLPQPQPLVPGKAEPSRAGLGHSQYSVRTPNTAPNLARQKWYWRMLLVLSSVLFFAVDREIVLLCSARGGRFKWFLQLYSIYRKRDTFVSYGWHKYFSPLTLIRISFSFIFSLLLLLYILYLICESHRKSCVSEWVVGLRLHWKNKDII